MVDRPRAAETQEMHGPPSAQLFGGLPVELTSFVGRETALAEIARLAAGSRLLTLTGPGGCGKSRLALQAAPLLAASCASRPVWVGLATLTDATLVPQAIAQALELPERAAARPIDLLVESLATQPVLLLLDNCEHVVEVAAETVDTLLRRCPALRVLATSREPLNIDGETAWLVPPLVTPTAGAETVEHVEQTEAGRLFVERARAILPGFSLNSANAAAVARICRRLDGMPLAIELAAARVRALGVEEIAARLERSFELLTSGRRTALPRQRTLRATIDWSYDLLAEPERRVLERLSVFVGGFGLEAAEAVASGDAVEPATVLDLLARLVDRSLVLAETRDGTVRYRLLEVIRQYARERLVARGAGEEAAVRTRHGDWYAAFAGRLGLSGTEQAAWMRRVDAEYSNLREAMQWALERDDAAAEAEIATSLWLYWLMRGYLAEGLQWLTTGLAGLPTGTALRAQALNGAGVMSCHRAEFQQAHTYFREGRAIWRELGSAEGEADHLYGMATAAELQGDYAQATVHLEEILGMPVGPRRRALSLMALASLALYRHEERAAALAEESLALLRQLDDARSVASALTVLGVIALEHDRLDEAVRRCEESLTMRRQLGDRGGAAHTLTVLGTIALRRGDLAGAAERYREAVTTRWEMGEPSGLASPMEGLAAAAVAADRLERATRLFGASAALRRRTATPATPLDRRLSDRYLTELRGRIDAASFTGAWSWGEQAPLAAVVAEALQADPDPAGHTSPGAAPPAVADETPPAAALEIWGFGPPRVVRAGRELAPGDWTYARARELLFYLLSHGPATKEQIGLALWPDASSAQLRSAFHSTVHHLRRALGDPAWIVLHGGRYAFNRSRPFRYDVAEFESEIAQAKRARHSDPARAAALLEAALARYTGDFLAGAAESDWALARQDALRRQCLDALLLLGDLCLSGDPARAAGAYRRAIALDPYLEVAHRGLMRCYTAEGQRALALRHFHELEALMRAELDAEPDPETEALYRRIQRGEPVD